MTGDGGHREREARTGESFAFKWERRGSYESPAMQEKSRRWLVERYFGSEEARRAFLAEARGKTVLDAGCGSGYSALLLFGADLSRMTYVGVDLSRAAQVARERFRERGLDGLFLQGSVDRLPFARPFDLIFCEGVLHHTRDTFASLAHLAGLLAPRGAIMFYVYRRKSPLREHADDLIRERLRGMDDQQAWDALLPLTRLGRAIGDLGVRVEVPEDVPLLGIPAGRHDLQRLLYWHVVKMFYDPALTEEEMNHINFDWYRPLYCHRHQPDEVRGWLDTLGLTAERFVAEEAGISVVARRKDGP